MKNLIGLLILLAPASVAPAQAPEPLVSRIAVLTIHVRDVAVHGQVFHFLTDVLRLPIDYGPEMLGERRYAAVYAGNMFVEPCGPFSNMRYPTNVFQALFYGLNCSSDQSPAALAQALQERKIRCEPAGAGTFRIQEPALSESIYLGISSAPLKDSERTKETSMRTAMLAKNRDALGLEYIKEVRLAYTDAANLEAWKQFIQPARLTDDQRWEIGANQSIRFIQADVKGVRGIVFKVRSLDQAKRRLEEDRLLGSSDGREIELNRERTFGLVIRLADK